MLIATFAGNIGRVQELRTTPTGKSVLGFVLGVDDGWGENKRTLWVDCTLWDRKAEGLAPHLAKGMALTVIGRPGLRTYEKDGQTHAVMTCRVDDLKMHGGGRQERPPEPRREQPRPAASDSFDDESIPF